MNVTNEIKRTKIKLRLFEQEGINWVLLDLIEFINKHEGKGKWTEKGKLWLIDKLKKRYKEFLEKNIPEDPKQKKLDL